MGSSSAALCGLALLLLSFVSGATAGTCEGASCARKGSSCDVTKGSPGDCFFSGCTCVAPVTKAPTSLPTNSPTKAPTMPPTKVPTMPPTKCATTATVIEQPADLDARFDAPLSIKLRGFNKVTVVEVAPGGEVRFEVVGQDKTIDTTNDPNHLGGWLKHPVPPSGADQKTATFDWSRVTAVKDSFVTSRSTSSAAGVSPLGLSKLGLAVAAAIGVGTGRVGSYTVPIAACMGALQLTGAWAETACDPALTVYVPVAPSDKWSYSLSKTSTSEYLLVLGIPVTAANCAGAWGAWGKCSKSCGGGTQTKPYVATVQGAHGGVSCPTPQSQKCNTQDCIILCPAPEGYFCTVGATTAARCPVGSYCEDGATVPEPCPLGKTSRKSSTSISSCYVKAGFFGYAGANNATACAFGRTSLPGSSRIESCSVEAGYYGYIALIGGKEVSRVTVCPAGTYCPAGSKKFIRCPEGSYCKLGQAVATRCPANKTSLAAAGSVDECTCVAGFCGLLGPSQCISLSTCPAGSACRFQVGVFKVGDDVECRSTGDSWRRGVVTSIKGRYTLLKVQDTKGTNKAWDEVQHIHNEETGVAHVTCPKHHYCPVGGNCQIPCPTATVSAMGSTDITNCTSPRGRFGAAGTEAKPCPANHYCDGGQDAATPCPNGKKSAAVTLEQSQSFYANDVQYLDIGKKPPVDHAGVAMCGCAAGTYGLRGADGVCTQCPPERHCRTGATAPESGLCPTNSYCAGGALHPCPLGTGSPAGSVTVGACSPQPGWYGASGVEAKRCPLGHWCKGGNDVAPIPCPVGKTTVAERCVLSQCYPGADQKSIDSCTAAVGYHGSAGAGDATRCTAGYTCPAGSLTVGGLCPKNFYCSLESRSPMMCMPNSISDAGSKDAKDCKAKPGHYGGDGDRAWPCPRDTFCAGGCPATNNWWDMAGGCHRGPACPPKKTSPPESTSLANCVARAGYYAPNTLAGVNVTRCPAGSWCPEGSTTVGGSCPEDHFCVEATLALRNVRCPANAVSSRGSKVVTECTSPPGFYGAAGQTAWPCTPGSYCVGGQDAPASCPDHKTSAHQAKSIADCVAAPGYFGKCQTGCTSAQVMRGKGAEGKGYAPVFPCPAGWLCLGGLWTGRIENGIAVWKPTGLPNLPQGDRCPEDYYCPKATPRAMKCPTGFVTRGTYQFHARSVNDCLVPMGAAPAALPTKAPTTVPEEVTPGPTACPAGFYCSGGKSVPCPENHYCPAGSTTPIRCSKGTAPMYTTASSGCRVRPYLPYYGRGYATVGQVVFYNGTKLKPSVNVPPGKENLQNPDPDPFGPQRKVTGDFLATAVGGDGYVYFQGKVIEGASGRTHEVLSAGYSRDSRNVFWRTHKLEAPPTKPSTKYFIVRGTRLYGDREEDQWSSGSWPSGKISAKPKNEPSGARYQYYQDVLIRAGGVSTGESRMPDYPTYVAGDGERAGWATDRYNCYFKGVIFSSMAEAKRNSGYDIASSKCLPVSTRAGGRRSMKSALSGYQWAHTYERKHGTSSSTSCTGVGADLSCRSRTRWMRVDGRKKHFYSSCEMPSPRCARNVMEGSEVLNGLTALTELGGQYLSHRSPSMCWYQFKRLEDCKAYNFRYAGKGYAMDSGRIWYLGKRVYGGFGSTSTFKILGSDSYVAGVDGVDRNWQTPRGGTYASWGQFVLYGDQIVKSSNSLGQFVYLGGGYAKDQGRAYYLGKVLPKVNQVSKFRSCAFNNDFAIMGEPETNGNIYFRGVAIHALKMGQKLVVGGKPVNTRLMLNGKAC